MTEQEIVNYLKENHNKGVAFGFMPEEVKIWCSENDSNLVYYSVNGTWLSGDNRSIFDWNEIVALPDSFQIQQEKKGGWVEFEINERGQFLVIFTQGLRYYFNWFEWWRLLEKSIDYNYGFITFGGWQYKDSKRWYLAPAVKLQDGEMWNSYVVRENREAIPVIPVKIRFWRKTN